MLLDCSPDYPTSVAVLDADVVLDPIPCVDMGKVYVATPDLDPRPRRFRREQEKRCAPGELATDRRDSNQRVLVALKALPMVMRPRSSRTGFLVAGAMFVFLWACPRCEIWESELDPPSVGQGFEKSQQIQTFVNPRAAQPPANKASSLAS